MHIYFFTSRLFFLDFLIVKTYCSSTISIFKMVCCCPVTTTLVVGAIAYFIYKKFFTPPTIKPKPAVSFLLRHYWIWQIYLQIHKTDYKKDTVYLYQFKRIKSCPNLSPFCMKLEILCRAYNIPYEVWDHWNFRALTQYFRLSKLQCLAQEMEHYRSLSSTVSILPIQIWSRFVWDNISKFQ